jgi:hypothetical protein
MNGKRLIATIVVVVLVSLSQSADAQLPNPSDNPNFGKPNTPTISPYLNLLSRSRGSFTGNYFTQYRPQQDFYRARNQARNSIYRLQQEQRAQAAGLRSEVQNVTGTGHTTFFMNFGGYFPR